MQHFTKDCRLKKADEFSSVFLFRRVVWGSYLKIHYKPNGLSCSRIGLVVSKRIHRKANRRNYMKRSLREFFRLNQANFQQFDIVVRVTKYFDKADRIKVDNEFIGLINRVGIIANSQNKNSSS